MECPQCKTANRQEAKYCKRCGAILLQSALASTADAIDGLIEDLVCLDQIKDELRKIKAVAAQLAKMPVPGRRLSFHTLIIGNAGSGKTKICGILEAIWRAYGLIKHVTVVEAADYHQKFARDFEQNFRKAKGGMLVFNDVQKLVPAGYSPGLDPLDKLFTEMRNSDGDPVVVLTGLPKGFREYVKENPRVKGLFSVVFELPDMGSEQLARVCEKELSARGFTLNGDARARLKARCRYLVKHKDETFDNGYLAVRLAEEIVRNFLARVGEGAPPDLIILPEDIGGPVAEEKSAEEILKSLDDLIGMEEVKREIRDLAMMLQVQKQRQEAEGRSFRPSLHIVLMGNPGTGKTTIARKLGAIFEAIGLLDRGHVVEVDRKDLVAGYVGQTAPQVNRKIDEAMGGILFIDEAYTLKQGDHDSFGQEAIEALMKRMEDDRGRFVVIAAGYEKEMERFLDANPGLRSRFTHYFRLPDYTPEELCEIFKVFARQEGYQLDPEAEEKVRRVLQERCLARDRNFANAREARTLFERALKNQARRIGSALSQQPEGVSTLKVEDIPDVVDESFEPVMSLEEAYAKLDALIGLDRVKAEVRRLANYLKAEKARMALGGKPYLLNVHFLFTGNPGTGKTTVARLLGAIFRGIGLLPRGHVVEVDRKDLVAEYLGQTAPKTNKVIDSALGGILFIDEAYTLARDAFGQEAIETLLKRMEDDRGKFVVIAAGYKKEMQEFLESNSGLASRFPEHIDFEDYTAEELTQIFLLMASERGMKLGEGVKERVQRIMQELILRKDRSFANARTVRNLFENVLKRQGERIGALLEQGEVDQETLHTILLEDVPDVVDQRLQPAVSLEEAYAKLDALIGLRKVKEELKRLAAYLQVEKARTAAGGKPYLLNVHFVFAGNPGTGKTTVARLLGAIFRAMGLLPKGHVVEVDRKDLVAEYLGQTAPKTNKVIDSALGGILFIDEAYTLARDAFGQEAIETLLKRMEDDRGKFVVIAAGYKEEMEQFLDANPGLRDRFTKHIDFEDYTAEELKQIFLSMMAERGMTLGEGVEERVQRVMENLVLRKDRGFANGRTVRNLFERVLERQAERLSVLLGQGGVDREALNTIVLEDLEGLSA